MKSHSPPRGVLLAIVVSSLFFPLDQALAQTGIDNLGDLSGGPLSSDGDLVLGKRSGSPNIFIWSVSSAETVISPVNGARHFWEGLAMSADGSFVVGADVADEYQHDENCDPDHDNFTAADRVLPWKWTNGSTSRLQPPDDFCYIATAVADNGTIVGVKFNADEGRWEAVNISDNFESLHPNGYDYSWVSGISADGSTVIGNGFRDGKERALLWNDSGSREIFDGLTTDVSDDGSVVVGHQTGVPAEDGYRWTASGLGVIAANVFGGPLVSGDGETVYYSTWGPVAQTQTFHARVWQLGAGDESLWQILTDLGIDASGWIFTSPGGVNEDGTVFTGYDQTKNVGFRASLAVCSPKRGISGSLVKWDNSGGGSFGIGGNWNSGSVPETEDFVMFATGAGAYSVVFNSGEQNARADIDGDDTTFQLNSNSYFLTGLPSTLPGGGCGELESIRVLGKQGRPSSLTVDGGTVRADGNVLVGTQGGAEAKMTITGNSSELIVPNTSGIPAKLIVADNASSRGTLLVDDGAKLSTNNIVLVGFENLSSGKLTVTDSGSRWFSRDTFAGGRGQGEIEILNGAEAEFSSLALGGDQLGRGHFLVKDSGSKLTVDALITIGSDGEGEIVVENGGELIGLGNTIVNIAQSTGTSGKLTVTGTGSTATDLGVLNVAVEGLGIVEVMNGASIESRSLLVGDQESGFVTIDGQNSELRLTDDQVQLSIGKTGQGLVEVTSGGRLDSPGGIVAGALPSQASGSGMGTLRISDISSEVITPLLLIGNASVGEVFVESNFLSVPQGIHVGIAGFNGDPTPSRLEVDGTGVVETSEVIVGAGNGIVRIRGNGRITANNVRTGTGTAPSRGEIFVEDSGSQLIVLGSLTIGEVGQGLLNVFSGGSAVIGNLQVSNGAVVGSNITFQSGSRKGKSASPAAGGSIIVSSLVLGDNAELQVDSIIVNNEATIGGSGSYPFNLTSSGMVSPGDSLGHVATFSADSSYAQNSDGVLLIELGGTGEGEYDRFVVTETASLSGTLQLSAINGFVPSRSDEFEILVAAQIEGTFDEIETDGDYIVDLIYSATSVKAVVTTFVAVEEPGNVPTEFALFQNYPNPFNPSTVIEFALPSVDHVRLTVYDALGRTIRTLLDGDVSAGRHQIHFDAGALPSGLYIYHLNTGSFDQSRVMLLTK